MTTQDRTAEVTGATTAFEPERGDLAGVVRRLVVMINQQQAELVAGVLAVQLAVALGLRRPVVAGDSASALGSTRKISCGAWVPGRAEALQALAVTLLRGGLTASRAARTLPTPSRARRVARRSSRG